MYVFISYNGQNGLCQYNVQEGYWRENIPRGKKISQKDLLSGAIGKEQAK